LPCPGGMNSCEGGGYVRLPTVRAGDGGLCNSCAGELPNEPCEEASPPPPALEQDDCGSKRQVVLPAGREHELCTGMLDPELRVGATVRPGASGCAKKVSLVVGVVAKPALVALLSALAVIYMGASLLMWTMKDSLTDASLCNVSAPILTPEPHGTWNLTAGERRTCYKRLVNGKPGAAGEDRNWCWIGWKNYGCYKSMFGVNPTLHLSWREMRAKAAGAEATPQQPSHAFQPLGSPEICDRRELGAARDWTGHQWAAAKAWLEQHVGVFVVNFPGNTKRWVHIHARLKSLGIESTRVPGVDMREYEAMPHYKQVGVIPQDFDPYRAQAEATKPEQGMQGIVGTVGCATAHFKAQAYAIKRKPWKPLAVVLEDDTIPSDDFIPRLWSLVREELPCDWDVVSLRSKCPYGFCVSPRLTRVQPDDNEPADRCHHGVNYGFQAVLYRVSSLPQLQERWKKVVFNETRPHCLDVDVALASISDTLGFYAVPFVQFPGFLRERFDISSRIKLDKHHKFALEQR